MGKLLDFEGRKKKKTEVLDQPDRETVLLWRVSKSLDDLIENAVQEQKLNAEEVAAIVAHRLGALIGVTENPPVLATFCCKVVRKVSDTEDNHAI